MIWFHQVPNNTRYMHILAAGAVLPHLPPSSIFDYLSSHHDLYREHPFFKSRLSFTADPDVNLATFKIFESHIGASIKSLRAEELRDWTERITSLALFLRKQTSNAFDNQQRFAHGVPPISFDHKRVVKVVSHVEQAVAAASGSSSAASSSTSPSPSLSLSDSRTLALPSTSSSPSANIISTLPPDMHSSTSNPSAVPSSSGSSTPAAAALAASQAYYLDHRPIPRPLQERLRLRAARADLAAGRAELATPPDDEWDVETEEELQAQRERRRARLQMIRAADNKKEKVHKRL